MAAAPQKRQPRNTVGLFGTAALPALWRALRERGHGVAEFARVIGVSSAQGTRILYGDRGAGRKPVRLCQEIYGVEPSLWDEPLPKRWRPHGQVRARGRPAAA